MNLYWSHASLHFIVVCLLMPIGWSYRSQGHAQYDAPFGSYPTAGTQNNGPNSYCPQPQPFRPNAEKVFDNVAYECLPSYLRNPNAVLDEDDGTTVWAGGQKPDYSIVNDMFNRERSIIHPQGSMEDRIQNLMKNYDKELLYKTNPQQWVTTVPQNFYMINNGGPRQSLAELAQLGSYNVFLGNSEFYSKNYINSSASDTVFRTTLQNGFAIEVVEVYSPPPRVSFKFRHFGRMSGPLRCPMRNGTWLNVAPHGNIVQFFGKTVLNLNEKYQILNVENSFRGDELMEQMVLGTGNALGNVGGNRGGNAGANAAAGYWT